MRPQLRASVLDPNNPIIQRCIRPWKPRPEGTGPAYYYYLKVEGTPYDYLTAWPWTKITDPHIRSAVFWRYTPFSSHAYAEAAALLGMSGAM